MKTDEFYEFIRKQIFEPKNKTTIEIRDFFSMFIEKVTSDWDNCKECVFVKQEFEKKPQYFDFLDKIDKNADYRYSACKRILCSKIAEEIINYFIQTIIFYKEKPIRPKRNIKQEINLINNFIEFVSNRTSYNYIKEKYELNTLKLYTKREKAIYSEVKHLQNLKLDLECEYDQKANKNRDIIFLLSPYKTKPNIRKIKYLLDEANETFDLKASDDITQLLKVITALQKKLLNFLQYN